MAETAPVANPIVNRKVRPPIDIAVTTLITMIILWLISNLSLITGVSLGAFAGFCMAAWNWLGLGLRRKALIHFIAGFGVYIFIMFGSVLIAILLALLFVRSVPMTVELPAIPGISPGSITVTDQLQNSWGPSVGSFWFNVLAGLLVIIYLYRATARAARQFVISDDGIDMHSVLPLFGVAAISVAFMTFCATTVWHIHMANVQNHVYCELLQPGMTHQEVTDTLEKFAPLTQMVFEDEDNSIRKQMPNAVLSWRWIMWGRALPASRYDLLELFVGYDAADKLTWLGRYWSDRDQWPRDGFDTITCPWTIVDNLTAK